jgi:Xaa-Pro aminopeptidase
MAEDSFLEYVPRDMVVPGEELAKRHEIVRGKMRERGLDLLLIAADMNIHKRGHVRYMTGYCTMDYYSYVLFPLEGEITFYGHYRGYARWAKALCGITKSAFTPFGEEEEVGASHVVKLIKDMKPKSVGLVGGYTIPTVLYKALVSALPDVRIEEASDIIAQCRIAKGPYEIGMVQKAAKVVDKAYKTYLDTVRPGRREYEVILEVMRTVYNEGGEGGIYLFTGGSVPHSRHENMAYRKIQTGDTLYFTSEISGPGGYWSQIGRMVSLGKREPEVEKAVKDFLEARKAALEELVPGSTVSRFIRKFLEIQAKLGYKSFDDQYGHGMGLDITEQPFITVDNQTVIKNGMVIALHPKFDLGRFSVRVCDTYLVTKDGPKNLYSIPEEYFVF